MPIIGSLAGGSAKGLGGIGSAVSAAWDGIVDYLVVAGGGSGGAAAGGAVRGRSGRAAGRGASSPGRRWPGASSCGARWASPSRYAGARP